MADQFAGADCGAKIMAADADLGATAGEIWVNQNCGTSQWSTVNLSNARRSLRFIQGGTYNIGIIFLGANTSIYSSINTVVLSYNGTGRAIETSGQNTVDGVYLSLGSSATDGFYLKGTEVTLSNYYYTGGGSTTKLVHVTAFDGVTQSGTIKLINGRGFNYTGIATYVDHALDVFMDNISSYGANPNTTAVGLVIDTGVSGLYGQNIAYVQHGSGGFIIKNSTGGAGAYNRWPEYIWLNTFLSDAAFLAPNFDGMLFDSTLSTNPVYFSCVNCWAGKICL